MTVDESPRQRSGGRAGRQAARARTHVAREPFLTRTLAPFEVLDDAGLSFDDRLLTSRDEVDSFMEEQGVETTPQVFIDGERIGGSEELASYLEKQEA